MLRIFGITLVELFAYVADHLSYQLDSVATEAFLRTARRRIWCGGTRGWSIIGCMTVQMRAPG